MERSNASIQNDLEPTHISYAHRRNYTRIRITAILLYFPIKDACQAFQTQRRNQINLLKKMRENAQKKKRKKKKVKRQTTG